MVGAGPAGCAAAWDLAAAGRSVLLLDRAAFPRHKACAGGLTRKTLRVLRYSVEPVTRTVVSSIVVEKRHGETATLASRQPVCALTVRQELDAFCLQKTLSAGAQFARIGSIEGIADDSETVTVRTAGQSFTGRFLVGADGVHSRVRQWLEGGGAPWLRRGFALEANVTAQGYSGDLIFDFAPVPHGYGWIFPKGDHVNVGLYTDAMAERLDRVRLLRWIAERFGDDAAADHLTGQYLGFGAENAVPAHQRVFLVGDAGGFADPLTGEGIYGAVSSGQAIAGAIDAALRGRGSARTLFAAKTERLRRDLQISSAGSRWFYANIDAGFRTLSSPLLRRAMISAFANGTRLAPLAATVRRLAAPLSAHDTERR